ncbi:MAG TPA: hypothetical protein ACQGQH_07195 [Xylella sp.]
MHWLFLLMAIGVMCAAFFITQMWLLLMTLCAALGLLLLWTCAQYSREHRRRSHDISSMVDAVELQRLHELAAVRRRAQVAVGNDDAGEGVKK